MARAKRKRNKASKPAQPKARHWLLWIFFGLLVPAFPTYIASRYLLLLGGTALWLPAEWRAAAGVIGTAIGLCVFHYCRLRPLRSAGDRTSTPAPDQQAACPPVNAEDVAPACDQLHTYRNAFVCLALVVVLLAAYYGLRSACVIHWTGAEDWVRANVSPSAGDAGRGPASSLTAVPSFIDPDRSLILVPAGVLRPPELRTYLELVASDPDNAGLGAPLTQVLDREPDRIIDILRGSGRMYLYAQVLLFFLLYLGIVSAFGAAIAFPFRSASAIGELAAELR